MEDISNFQVWASGGRGCGVYISGFKRQNVIPEYGIISVLHSSAYVYTVQELLMHVQITIDRKKVAAFCQRHHVTELALFGSVLR